MSESEIALMAMRRKPSPKKSAASSALDAAKQLELELVQYKLGNQAINFNLDVDHETVWATQEQIATLYERDRTTVAKHIAAIFSDGELDEKAVCAKFAHTASDGKTYEILHYDLDVILSVGFRVKSPRAIEFRRWAMSTLRAYLTDGYAVNEARLKNDPASLKKLAAEIRRLRSDEQNVYAAVRDVFKESAIDYDPKSPQCRRFYSTLQDKFHYAIHEKTAAGLIIERASHKKPNMGVQSFGGNAPSLDEAKIAKNYLEGDELYTLHILCEQFLLYAESAAIRGKQLTMAQLSEKLDSLLAVGDYPVFKGYKAALAEKATKHAQAEYALWLRRLKKEEEPRQLSN